MRIFIAVFAGILVSGCSAARPVGSAGNGNPTNDPRTDPPIAQTDSGFPNGWDKWVQIDEVTEAEAGEVRELYANEKATGAPYPAGSILVKAQFKLSAGKRGSLFQLSVMRKSSRGWEYEAYGPDGTEREADAEVCGLCHSQRQSNDFVFTAR